MPPGDDEQAEPGEVEQTEPGAEDGEQAPPGSKFYQGLISELLLGAERGTVRSAAGKSIDFDFRHVIMVGPVKKPQELRRGMTVGYDVSWTSSGLRVSVIYATEA